MLRSLLATAIAIASVASPASADIRQNYQTQESAYDKQQTACRNIYYYYSQFSKTKSAFYTQGDRYFVDKDGGVLYKVNGSGKHCSMTRVAPFNVEHEHAMAHWMNNLYIIEGNDLVLYIEDTRTGKVRREVVGVPYL